jgi:hypothetical protein
MHVVIFKDRNELNETVLVNEILKDIEQYFKSNYFVREITIQPEILKVILFYTLNILNLTKSNLYKR